MPHLEECLVEPLSDILNLQTQEDPQIIRDDGNGP